MDKLGNWSGTLTVKVDKSVWKTLKKAMGINKLSRKRARKLYMSVGIQRNDAEWMARNLSREENYVRWLMEECKEE